MRLFFAIAPDTEALDAVEQLRQHLPAPEHSRAVPLANTHLTLAFLGNTPPVLLEELCHRAAQLSNKPGLPVAPVAPPATLTLDHIGWFRRSHVLWLGPSQVPDSLSQLAKALRQLSSELGLHTEQREFRPHVTLYRYVRRRPAWPEQVKPITLRCRRFGLYASISKQGKTRYQLLGNWVIPSSIFHQSPINSAK